MIIGINGKIGSGKDTVGRIIQYLVDFYTLQKDFPDAATDLPDNPNKEDFDEWLFNMGDSEENNVWEIKKFAGKLKQIASLLIGIDVEDLEKEEVKNSYLGEKWITKHHNWITKEQLKVYAKELNKDIESYILSTKDLEYLGNDGIRDLYRFTTLDKKPTVRQFLQQLGTEAIRNNIHENAWVNALFVDYKIIVSNQIDNLDSGEKYPNWIITDVRFPNELKAVKDRKGISVRINRNYYDYCGQRYTWFQLENEVFKTTNEKPTKKYADEHWLIKSNHISETALDNAEFDYVIDNDSTIDELIDKVKEILIKEKII